MSPDTARHEISKRDYFVTLLLDELAYRVLRRISRRALRRDRAAQPLCVSTTCLLGHRLISTGGFERTQIDALDALIRDEARLPGLALASRDTFIDVGANVGYYTTRYAPHFRRTLAIEASPITFDILKGNLALARSPNVVPLCVGASDHDGQLPLHMRTGGQIGWSSFESRADADTFSIDVPLQTIDDLVGTHAPGAAVSLIKIDVEGHEARVLRGASRTLSRHKPIVLYEKLDGADGAACMEILERAGYRNFYRFSRSLNPSRLFSRPPVYAQRIDPAEKGHVPLVCAF